MKSTLLLASVFAGLVACSAPASDAPAPATPAPETQAATPATVLQAETRLAGVLVYADWCGSCKILDPKLEEAKAMGDIDGLQHIVLDYTARDDEAFFAAADALGIGTPIREKLSEGVKTGILLLVDIDDQEIVGDLRKELSIEDIRSQMESAAAAA